MADSPPLTDEEMRALFGDGNAPAAPASSALPAAPSPLTPEQERTLFPPAAAAPAKPPGVTPTDALEAFQAGTLQGMGNVAGGIQRLFGYDPSLTDRTNALLTPEQKAGMAAHPWAAGGGRILGETAATAPVMIAGGELLPTFGAASVPALVARGGLYGAASGALGNMLTSGGAPDESLGHRALTGAEWGLPFGMLGGYAEAATGAGQKVSEATQAAGKEMQEAGVDVAPGNLPRIGGTKAGGPPTDAQAVQINKAFGNIIGQDTPNFSSDTLNKVIPDLGKDVGNTVRAGKIDYDIPTSNGQTFEDRLADIEANTDRRQVKNIINKIVQKVDASGEISGADLGDLLKTNNPLDSATRSRVPEISEPAIEIEQAIHDAFTQSSSPAISQAYSLAREKYKLALAGEQAADPVSGNIDPSRIMQVFTRMYPDAKRIGSGTSMTDQAVNFARNTARTFGGTASASPVYSHGGWLAPIATTAVGAAEMAPHVVPFALPQTLSNPLMAGTMLAAPFAMRGIRELGHAYQGTPSFANALLARGPQVGGPYLSTLGADVGASIGDQLR